MKKVNISSFREKLREISSLLKDKSTLDNISKE